MEKIESTKIRAFGRMIKNLSGRKSERNIDRKNMRERGSHDMDLWCHLHYQSMVIMAKKMQCERTHTHTHTNYGSTLRQEQRKKYVEKWDRRRDSGR